MKRKRMAAGVLAATMAVGLLAGCGDKNSETEAEWSGKFTDLDYTEMDSLTLTKYMGNGINLGITM